MKILFICTGNAYRSPLAEALLKQFRPDLEVDSAGLNVAIPIANEIMDYLKVINAEENLKSHPERLDGKNLRDYDLIIAMEPIHKNAVISMCPECAKNVMLWNIEDPYCEEREVATRIFNKIRIKVKELAKSL